MHIKNHALYQKSLKRLEYFKYVRQRENFLIFAEQFGDYIFLSSKYPKSYVNLLV